VIGRLPTPDDLEEWDNGFAGCCVGGHDEWKHNDNGNDWHGRDKMDDQRELFRFLGPSLALTR
jgi:hypothetical protein